MNIMQKSKKNAKKKSDYVPYYGPKECQDCPHFRPTKDENGECLNWDCMAIWCNKGVTEN